MCSQIIELSGAEIEKLRLANWELARANSQMMAVCFFLPKKMLARKGSDFVLFSVQVFVMWLIY